MSDIKPIISFKVDEYYLQANPFINHSKRAEFYINLFESLSTGNLTYKDNLLSLDPTCIHVSKDIAQYWLDHSELYPEDMTAEELSMFLVNSGPHIDANLDSMTIEVYTGAVTLDNGQKWPDCVVENQYETGISAETEPIQALAYLKQLMLMYEAEAHILPCEPATKVDIDISSIEDSESYARVIDTAIADYENAINPFLLMMWNTSDSSEYTIHEYGRIDYDQIDNPTEIEDLLNLFQEMFCRDGETTCVLDLYDFHNYSLKFPSQEDLDDMTRCFDCAPANAWDTTTNPYTFLWSM